MSKSLFDGAKKQLKAATRYKFWILAILGLIFIACLFIFNKHSSRTESYKTISGPSAGLEATITYGACKKQPCDNETFNFNVYIFKDDGGQVAVIRPDKNGQVNAALPAGEYLMLIGRQLDKNKRFPQEPVTLKSGKTLELKLHYE